MRWKTKEANVTIVFITRVLALPGKREPEKCLFLETPMLSTYTTEQEMLPFKAINRYQNKELLCHWISVNLKMVVEKNHLYKNWSSNLRLDDMLMFRSWSHNVIQLIGFVYFSWNSKLPLGEWHWLKWICSIFLTISFVLVCFLTSILRQPYPSGKIGKAMIAETCFPLVIQPFSGGILNSEESCLYWSGRHWGWGREREDENTWNPSLFSWLFGFAVFREK